MITALATSGTSISGSVPCCVRCGTITHRVDMHSRKCANVACGHVVDFLCYDKKHGSKGLIANWVVAAADPDAKKIEPIRTYKKPYRNRTRRT